MSEHGDISVYYTKSGLPRYELEIRHKGLSKYQLIRGDSKYVVEQKARAVMAQWDAMWERRQEGENKRLERQRRAQSIEEKKQLAAERTQEAQRILTVPDHILSDTLAIDDTIDWESLKERRDYPIPKPSEPVLPEPPDPLKLPPEPKRSDLRYNKKVGFLDEFLDSLFPSRKITRKREADNRFNHDRQQWHKIKGEQTVLYQSRMDEYEKKVKQLEAQYQAAASEWENARATYIRKRDEHNAEIHEKRNAYLNGNPEAISDYCGMVLSNSKYPDYFPQSYDLGYLPENKTLIIDYQLPPVDNMPTLKEVRYIQSKDEFVESHISQAQLNATYDSLLYQIALRTIHELFEADKINALVSVAFNGYIRSIDKAIGQEVNPCVLSLLVNREEIERINLANVDPRACFKMLKGVGSSKLHSLSPIPPILKMEREDKRFVEPYAVVDDLQEGDNLAAMDWEDFENLVRELFAEEFSSPGSEVKITRASRDGGIDAVVFDPDPLRGGKTVIQAKRYTNVVGVSAVRDLYGTLINEGAGKGILVTTADYGPDAYEFAKGKPLVLLNGGNLLHLLEKHGHKAYIDLKEAKKLMTNGQLG